MLFAIHSGLFSTTFTGQLLDKLSERAVKSVFIDIRPDEYFREICLIYMIIMNYEFIV